nr:glycosyltransferase family 39 protein [Caldilineaceae bacterium]
MSAPFWSRRRTALYWVGLLLLAWLVRLPRLSWQPLWWDEGYSTYFASEPWPRMLALTAADIHPPLYYALLHFWLELTQNIRPETERLFSVLIGLFGVVFLIALARRLYPQQPWVVWLAALLLTVSPWHLFYSQEV